LLVGTMTRVAPWPVNFVDPAPAIARRLVDVLASAPARIVEGQATDPAPAYFTGGAPGKALAAALARLDLATVTLEL
ncbi:MAG: glutamate racemase, partial [Hyphomicrobiales bacterium]|nr:glutamate racemase [Hyphomicrobiales bacterium]